jgi:hypothetical protein
LQQIEKCDGELRIERGLFTGIPRAAEPVSRMTVSLMSQAKKFQLFHLREVLPTQ